MSIAELLRRALTRDHLDAAMDRVRAKTLSSRDLQRPRPDELRLFERVEPPKSQEEARDAPKRDRD